MNQRTRMISLSALAFVAISGIIYIAVSAEGKDKTEVKDSKTITSREVNSTNSLEDGKNVLKERSVIVKKASSATETKKSVKQKLTSKEVSDAKKIVSSIKNPTEEDIKNLNNDGRYGDASFREFSKEITSRAIPGISGEKLDKVVDISAIFAHKSNALTSKYEDDEIDFELYLKTQYELSKETGEKLKQVLTDEEYKKLNWKIPELPEDFERAKIQAMLPGVDIDKIQKNIDLSTLEQVANITEEYNKNFGKYNREFAGNYEAFEQDMKQLRAQYEEDISNTLSGEQIKIIFGDNFFQETRGE